MRSPDFVSLPSSRSNSKVPNRIIRLGGSCACIRIASNSGLLGVQYTGRFPGGGLIFGRLADNPSPRYSHSTAFDPVARNMVLSGGFVRPHYASPEYRRPFVRHTIVDTQLMTTE